MMHRKPYQLLAMGGTFDHFHVGHEHFIDFAAKLSDKIIIGVTNQALSQQKQYASTIEPFFIRKRHVIHYCNKQHIRAEVIELNDAYGPTIDPDLPIQAIAVTEYTQQGAKPINQIRTKLRLRDLSVHVCSMLKDEQGKVISSTRIRSGEIDRDGQQWLPNLQNTLKLTKEQRQFFSRKQGDLVDLKQFSPPTTAYVVGDRTMSTFLEQHWPFQLAIFDQVTQREPIESIISDSEVGIRCNNPAGSITPELVQAIKQAFDQKITYLKVTGEEDLATLVVVLAAPLGSSVFYGQPEEGIVQLEVTEILKKKFFDHLFHPRA